MSEIVRPSRIQAAPPHLSLPSKQDALVCSAEQQREIQQLLTQLVQHYDPEHWCELVIGCNVTDIDRVSVYAAEEVIRRLHLAVNGLDLLPTGDL